MEHGGLRAWRLNSLAHLSVDAVDRTSPTQVARLGEADADVQLAAVRVLIAAITQSGDFLARRTTEQVWPRLGALLADASALDERTVRKPLHAFSATHRAHRAAFQAARAIVTHHQPTGRPLRAMAAAAVRALRADLAVVRGRAP